MNNPQFSVLYNGHPVSVTMLDDATYLVQVTYKPVHIESRKNRDGSENWVDVETQQETYLTKEIGKLISEHHYSVEAV